MMVIIFWFSSQPADDSARVSSSVDYFICEKTIPEFTTLGPGMQRLLTEAVDYQIRKCAHAGEYLILAILCTASLFAWRKELRRAKDRSDTNQRYGIHWNRLHPNDAQQKMPEQTAGLIFLLFLGWGIAVLYSVTDEIHQMFVPGRACMFTDILIDSAGALTGVLLFAAVWFPIHKYRQMICINT